MDQGLRRTVEIARGLRLRPGVKVDLRHDHDPAATPGVDGRSEGEERLAEGLALLGELQDRLAAEAERAILLVLQGLDAAGKDGTVKHVMSGINPQGVEIHSFKRPTPVELSHDWLWRHQCVAPALGRIGIFNRSHYEEVLVERVHPELLAGEAGGRGVAGNDKTWKERFRAINEWERHLEECGTRVVKVMLHISRREQAERFLARIDHPQKNWKFSDADVAEHQFYDDYQRAFAAMLEATTSAAAPWHVVPADHKWYARLATAGVLVEALAALDPQYPEPDAPARARMLAARAGLVDELEGSPAD